MAKLIDKYSKFNSFFFIVMMGACMSARDGKEEWVLLFDGTDLSNWIVKIHHHEVGDNFGNTFSAEDGMIKVRFSMMTSTTGSLISTSRGLSRS